MTHKCLPSAPWLKNPSNMSQTVRTFVLIFKKIDWTSLWSEHILRTQAKEDGEVLA